MATIKHILFTAEFTEPIEECPAEFKPTLPFSMYTYKINEFIFHLYLATQKISIIVNDPLYAETLPVEINIILDAIKLPPIYNIQIKNIVVHYKANTEIVLLPDAQYIDPVAERKKCRIARVQEQIIALEKKQARFNKPLSPRYNRNRQQRLDRHQNLKTSIEQQIQEKQQAVDALQHEIDHRLWGTKTITLLHGSCTLIHKTCMFRGCTSFEHARNDIEQFKTYLSAADAAKLEMDFDV